MRGVAFGGRGFIRRGTIVYNQIDSKVLTILDRVKKLPSLSFIFGYYISHAL